VPVNGGAFLSDPGRRRQDRETSDGMRRRACGIGRIRVPRARQSRLSLPLTGARVAQEDSVRPLRTPPGAGITLKNEYLYRETNCVRQSEWPILAERTQEGTKPGPGSGLVGHAAAPASLAALGRLLELARWPALCVIP
jgi:hypothetical protein